jgi:hypothetical protein
MMQNIEMNIQRLGQCLSTFCAPLYERLQEPLNQEITISVLDKWGYDDELILEIFKWKNGILYDEVFPTYLFDYTGFGVIPSLEYVEEILEIERKDKSWRESLFPLTTSFAGDFLLYETNKNSKHYGAIYLYSPNLGYVDYLPIYFDSIYSMIDTIIQNFELGAFKYINMSLEIDYELREDISRRLNPKAEYWRE